ncbi:uncharacterized protein LY89DRAFT_776649 [Mollisia scopiformis]|uniref:Uncharacterized protein n=1 Tax=Mollisia scopiformis TaxID=149040 RepID=A0A194XXK6_MOLSC|nr:uncharacterized protein LY89DRAFT_776649 [Mollisia scopiformis]KUJ24557.1 hypothetical protein LY89DRAFT_776649 [Mollisia scopiformis]
MMLSEELRSEVPVSPYEFCEAAFELRNALLFRESLIWIVGPHSNPNFEQFKARGYDDKLESIARCAYGKLAVKVNNALSTVLMAALREINTPVYTASNQLVGVIADLMAEVTADDPSNSKVRLKLPEFLRQIFRNSPLIANLTKDRCGGLLDSKLVIDKGTYQVGVDDARRGRGGLEDCNDRFFCAEIDDEDLPWDINETEW